MGVNSLPKTVARQRRGCDLNPCPSAPESSTLTTRLPSHLVMIVGLISVSLGRMFTTQHIVCLAQSIMFSFIIARRYASAVFAVVVCPSVHPSVRHKPVLCRNDWTNRVAFGVKVSFHRPHCVIRKFGVSPKIRVLPSWTLFQTPDLNISPRQVDRVVNKIRRRRQSSLLTTPIRHSTSRGCLLQVGQLLPSNTDTSISCGFVIQLVSTVDKILTGIARRAVRLRQHNLFCV